MFAYELNAWINANTSKDEISFFYLNVGTHGFI